MTPLEAWGIISANLKNHYAFRRAMYPNDKGYTEAEIEAEMICFHALQEMEKREKAERGDNNGC